MDFEHLTAFEVFGLPVYRYGLFIGAGALLMCLAALLRAGKEHRASVLAACAAALPCALVLSRLLYCLTDQRFVGIAPLDKVFSLTNGGFSMLGALLGAALGVVIVCRIGKKKVLPVMDQMVTGVPLFLICARAAEFFSDEFGVSKPLKTEWLEDTFLTVDSSYLMVYVLEAAFAALLFVIMLCCKKDRTVVFTLLFTAAQGIFESLKKADKHMAFGFVGVQHILSYTILAVTVIVLGALARKKGKKALPLAGWISAVPVAGIAVGLEFLYDRTNTAPMLLYAAYLVLVVYMAGLGFALLRASRSPGQEKEN